LALLRAVEGFLGESLDEAANQAIAIDAQVQGDSAHGYAARLSFVSAHGNTARALEHPSCDKLTEGVALLVALGIDPERVRAQQGAVAAATPKVVEDPPPPPPTSPPNSAPAEAMPVADRPAPSSVVRDEPSTESVRANVAVVGLVGGGMLPGATPGIGPEVALRVGHVEAAAVGRFWATRGAAVPGTADASVDLSLFTAGLRLCGVPTFRSWSWFVCARGDLGRMSGQGQLVNQAETRSDWFAGLGGSFEVAYAVGRLSPVAGVDVLGLVDRPRFGVVRGSREVEAFRPKSWQVSGFIGLAYAL
jgi:hypothetical protein